MNCETAKEIELRVAHWFGIRQHLIVPNVSWGLLPHECDLVVMRSSGYLIEVEIKISKSDLIADLKKPHMHQSNMIKMLYFAMPEKLLPAIEHVPERAGILIVSKTGYVRLLREAAENRSATKLSGEDMFQLARLGALRIWRLEQKLLEAKHDIVRLKNL